VPKTQLYPPSTTWVPTNLPTSIPRTLVAKCANYIPSTALVTPIHTITPETTYVLPPSSIPWYPTYVPSIPPSTVIERCDEIIAEAPVAPIENLVAAPVILD